MIKIASASVVVLVILLLAVFINRTSGLPQNSSPIEETRSQAPTSASPFLLNTPPQSKILQNNYHIFQTFNNCGPAALSYYGINASQQELGLALRPYQVPGGNNDDKSVTLEELAQKSKEYGLVPFHRPNGDIEKIKMFVTYDMPVIARTWTKPNEDIGHYRIVKGYDQSKGEIIQDDSLQNKNLRYTYQNFNEIWNKFNFEYLILVPKEKEKIAKAILAEDADEKAAWEKAVQNARKELAVNPKDITWRFNLSVALYNIGDYQGSVNEFEKVEALLPFRTLWYQIEPIQAYFEIGNYDRVFAITDKILNNHNRAFSELYLIRGKIYQKQGKTDLAKNEFVKAVFYNRNFSSIIPDLP